MERYDVGIYGLWYGHNYGSMITYFALSEVLKAMGYSFAMIKNPLGANVDPNTLRRSHVLRFAAEHYPITPLYRLDEMGKHNEMFDKFLLGSDQMWNYNLSRPYRQSYFLDFADDDKRKLAYATSFGRETYNGPQEEIPETRKNLARFNAISVRDAFSKDILRDTFGADSSVVMDPAFLCPPERYDALIAEAGEFGPDGDYMFAYILDPNPEIGAELEKIAAESGLRIIVALNEAGDKDALIAALALRGDRIACLREPTIQEWLFLVKNARFVLTDSFHGTCFSIIFRKPFITLKNQRRGPERFPHLLGTFQLSDRMILRPNEFFQKFSETGLNASIGDTAKGAEPVAYSRDWLSAALAALPLPKTPVSVPAKPMTLKPDIERCRMIVSLMKSYGIRHIVMSSGTRNLSLARFFEANDCFDVHLVTDERSAAYFALGMSVKLNYEPIVICCTSGTAVCNYLSGVTEAFHQRVPLIILTGDRYPSFLGQMEAQMIQQYGMFRDVCKKSVTLPINWDPAGQWEARRMVCDCILECTHFVKGPVHINMPINVIEHSPPPPETLALIPVKTIRRTDFFSPPSQWEAHVKRLKAAKKIMVIYGQNNPLSAEDRKYFDLFTEKYNCVVLTDHLSNVYGEYCLNPFRLMRTLTNDQFKKTLLPDLMIYVGGKRVLNCPLQGKIKSIIRTIPFWHVVEDGSLIDIYRKLTDIFGCSQSQFFKYFAERAGDIRNDKNYLTDWKNAAARVPAVDWSVIDWEKTPEKFTAYYTMGRLIENLPKDSMLHLSVGTTFINSQNFPLDPSVTVYCNMGTNGIDGSCSSFMGQCAVDDKLSFLLIGDLSFFYDMNSLWNKAPGGHVRILLNNNHGTDLLRHYQSRSITHAHGATAEGWVRSLGYFRYLCAHDREEFETLLKEFVKPESEQAIFFEVLF